MRLFLRWRRPSLVVSSLLLTAALGSCGEDPADIGADRAEQARTAARAAGLDDDVADFLALASRGATATYQATYPGPTEASELVVANDPPDRRVDIVADDLVVEVRLVLDGEAFRCERDDERDEIGACERTDVVVGTPGPFADDTLDDLTASLGARTDDFTFRIETQPIAGVDASCLVTEVREGRERPELGVAGTICVSPEGALLKVDQAGQSLEAVDYATEIPDNTFVRPDRPG